MEALQIGGRMVIAFLFSLAAAITSEPTLASADPSPTGTPVNLVSYNSRCPETDGLVDRVNAANREERSEAARNLGINASPMDVLVALSGLSLRTFECGQRMGDAELQARLWNLAATYSNMEAAMAASFIGHSMYSTEQTVLKQMCVDAARTAVSHSALVRKASRNDDTLRLAGVIEAQAIDLVRRVAPERVYDLETLGI